ncbi:MAG TPA: TRAP transporter large permease subunit [Alphaproteobacteria bacterium]|nr:TRAP transporter large permease subunit [Alphaproteobacteria bacterium]
MDGAALPALAHALPAIMLACLAVLLFSGFPVALVLAGTGLGFGLIGHLLGSFRLVEFGIGYHRIIGNLTEGEDLVYSAIPALIFMGALLERSGMAHDALAALNVLLRRIPGRLVLAVMGLGVALAPAAGVIGASVATLALIALPTMIQQGYSKPLAAGTVAAAGTLGIVFPPAIMLFFLADAVSLQLPFIFLAMMLPVAALLVLFAAYGLLRCRLDPRAEQGGPAAGGAAELITALRSLLLPLLLLGLVLLLIMSRRATPMQSGVLGAAGALLLLLFRRGFNMKALHETVLTTAETTSMVFFVIIGATVFSGVFVVLGGGEWIARLIHGAELGRWGTLALIMLIIFVMGFFFDWIEILIIAFPVFVPILAGLDFTDHVGPPYLVQGWIGILLALNLQTSFLTPPFGFALFFLKGAAPKEVRMADIYAGVLPFLAIQVLVIGLVAGLPAMATWLPTHVLQFASTPNINMAE